MSRPMKVTNDDYSDYDDWSYDGVIDDQIYDNESNEDCDVELDTSIWDVYEDDDTMIRSSIHLR